MENLYIFKLVQFSNFFWVQVTKETIQYSVFFIRFPPDSPSFFFLTFVFFLPFSFDMIILATVSNNKNNNNENE